MEKVRVHPHPSLDISCKHCRYWHPSYIADFVIFPNGQAAKMADVLKQGMPILTGALSERSSMCFYSVPWTQTGEDLYCAHFLPRHD